MNRHNLVTITGGTGGFTLLSGLKKLVDEWQIAITAVVSMADSGGSSGILRDLLGALPPGDVLQALLALSNHAGAPHVRELLRARFGEEYPLLTGHNMGNLFLTFLSQRLGSFPEAVEAFGKLLEIRGKVVPVTTGSIELCAEYENGLVIRGETYIDQPKERDPHSRIRRLWLEPNAIAYGGALEAIARADLLVFGPGDLYTSVLSVVLVSEVREAIVQSQARRVMIVPTMAKNETYGFAISHFVRELEKYAGQTMDFVIVNTSHPPQAVLRRYGKEDKHPVEVDVSGRWEERQVMAAPLLAQGELARHDSDKLAALVATLLE